MNESRRRRCRNDGYRVWTSKAGSGMDIGKILITCRPVSMSSLVVRECRCLHSMLPQATDYLCRHSLRCTALHLSSKNSISQMTTKGVERHSWFRSVLIAELSTFASTTREEWTGKTTRQTKRISLCVTGEARETAKSHVRGKSSPEPSSPPGSGRSTRFLLSPECRTARCVSRRAIRMASSQRSCGQERENRSMCQSCSYEHHASSGDHNLESLCRTKARR